MRPGGPQQTFLRPLPGRPAEGAILRVTVIKMDSDCEDFLEDRDGRLNEHLAFFFRPPHAVRAIHSLGDRNAEVLMERHKP
jgi:hypothetical protein